MYTKQLRQHESMATYINHDHIIYCNYYPTPEGLTRPERQAHALLSEVTAKTIIGIGIGTGLAAGTLPAFRELIKELQDCIEDNPKVMQGVLGNECFEAVIKLGYNNVLHK